MSAAVRMMCKSVLLYLLIVPASRSETLEYQLEAAFMFNFTQFVEWPPTAFARPDSPLVIGVLGEDPFGSYLNDIVHGEIVNGHPITVEHYRIASEIQKCHVLFFADSERSSFRATLIALKDRSVLTVSNLEGFAMAGGIMRFRVVDNRLRLRINIHAAHDAQLTVSSKLLRQAEIIGDVED